jgi:hypothetical protein
MNSAAHAGLMCHLKYQGDADYELWLKSSFKKVTCQVTAAEFDMLKSVTDNFVVTESRLNGEEIAVVLKPRQPSDMPSFMSLLKLWK